MSFQSKLGSQCLQRLGLCRPSCMEPFFLNRQKVHKNNIKHKNNFLAAVSLRAQVMLPLCDGVEWWPDQIFHVNLTFDLLRTYCHDVILLPELDICVHFLGINRMNCWLKAKNAMPPNSSHWCIVFTWTGCTDGQPESIKKWINMKWLHTGRPT